MVANENGGRKKITKLAAITKQLVNKAAAGDARSIKLLMELLRQNGSDTATESITIVISPDDDRL